MKFELDNRIMEFSEYLADEARKIIIPRYRQRFKIEDKSDATPVTEVDREVEVAIRKLVKNNFPEHGVIGEEFPSESADADFVWVVDPIDGTKSFITGRPLFGTLIALAYKGAPVLGLIDQPILKERWLGANGLTKLGFSRVFTRNCVDIDKAYFATTSLEMFFGGDLTRVQHIAKSCKTAIYGGDCYSYGQLAMGSVDVIIEAGLKSYDYMALVPVIENAGGKITDWNGNALDIYSNGKVLACGDPVLHARILQELG